VFDGDGNLLMSLGTLAMVGSLGPRNFVHLVFDNEVYGSTGGQRSLSRDVRLDRLARGAGYRPATAGAPPDEVAAARRGGRARGRARTSSWPRSPRWRPRRRGFRTVPRPSATGFAAR